MPKSRENYLNVVLGLLSMVFTLYIGSSLLKPLQWDVTEESLYTLSDGSKAMLKKLDGDIELKLYYSKTAANKGSEALRQFNQHYLYVRDLLQQYVRFSHNKLKLQWIDPRPDTPEEEDAQAYGLRKFPISETESYFFGLVAIHSSGTEKVIEFFDPSRADKLEYEITKLLYTSMNPQKKKIGILSSLDVMKDNDNPYMEQIMRMQGKAVESSWLITKLLQEVHTIENFGKELNELPSVDALWIVHPKDFSEKTLYYVDQFLLRGGKILLQVDPHAVSDRSGAMMGQFSSSPDAGFKKLMNKWGVDIQEGYFAGDKYLSGMGRYSPDMPPSRLLALLQCNLQCSESFEDPIASGLNQMSLVFPGVLKDLPAEGVEKKTILATTPKGNAYPAQPYQMNNPRMMWSQFREGDTPVVLAMRLQGKFSTAFPDGEPKQAKSDGKEQKKEAGLLALRESEKESMIVVFSDVDFVADGFAFSNSFLGPVAANDNASLFLNAVEASLGDQDLLRVRSKNKKDRSFDVIAEIEFAAEKRTEAKVNEINSSISRFQQELNQLGSQATEDNIALLRNEGLEKKKQLAKKIAQLKRELREVKRQGREQIESLAKVFQYTNTLFSPLLLIGLGFCYQRARMRGLRRAIEKIKSGISA